MDKAEIHHILLCADPNTEVGDLRRALRDARIDVTQHALGTHDPENVETFQIVVLDATRNPSEGLALCRRLRGRMGDGCLPTLFITSDASPTARLASLESGADAYLLKPFDPAELLAHVKTLLRNKERHDRLTEKTAEVSRINRRLQEAYQQINGELEIARRIQESFLPQKMPETPGLRFAVHYQPCGRVGGDFYDVFRLDENHVGMYVADAMGHGVPASLLTIFVKTSVRAKEIHGKDYRLVPPNEVLERLNRELIEQRLSDTPFVTMVYALLNFREPSISFARSGHPYPAYVPAAGQVQQWPAEGSLLGVFDTRCTVRTERLQPGDKVLLFTDGIDTASYRDYAPGTSSLLAFANEHRHLPIGEMIRVLPLELFKTSRQNDDLTMLGLEIQP